MYSLATASTPGFTLYTQKTTGRKFVACVCTAEWLPLLEQMALKRGIIKQCLDIIQIVGGDPASGGTHVQGAAIDVEQVGPAFVQLCREAGANATWSRYPPQFSNDHTHITLTDCPHDGPCAYQTRAQSLGFDGLGQGKYAPHVGEWGYGGKDPFPAVTPRRNYRQGIDWMKSQLTPAPAPAPTAPVDEDIDMAQNVLAGPVKYFPVVVPNDGREYQLDLAFAAGATERNISILIFKRVPTVGTPSQVSRNLTYKWQRDVPGKITLQKGEGVASISFDGTPDQHLAIALTPTGKRL